MRLAQPIELCADPVFAREDLSLNKSFRVALAVIVLAAVLGSLVLARPSQVSSSTAKDASLECPHDFDFLVGRWTTHHRVLKERLAGSHEWVEFDGTYDFRQVMNGCGNVGDNLFQRPDGAFRGVSLRSYDRKTGQWSVWWLDGRNPSANLDPPTKGHFENGTGTFYSDDMLRGNPIRVRLTWHHTSTSVHWEQAFSSDGGKTWETNWVTEFHRVS
jgi:hypothetical protein